MEEFREEEVTIDLPNGTVIFPVGFDEQIARVWWGTDDGVNGMKGCEKEREGILIFFFFLMFVDNYSNLGLYIGNWGFCCSIFMCCNQYGAI